MSLQLDEVDRGIIRALARNGRDATTRKMADQTGVSPSTIRNRLDRLERRGVIQGYVPEIDYGAVGLSLRVVLVCTVSAGDRHTSPDDLADLDGITSVAETIADRSTIYATAVAADPVEVERRVDHVHAAGLTVERAEILSGVHRRPCNHPRLVAVDREP